ncbi:MAG: 50S ribosomal protein L32, partial [Hyphomonadaceae bacterium]|nr:50S ribosomal protein L32 [Hyphomonadaceae bacterium]
MSYSAIKRAASLMVVSGVTVFTSRVIASRTSIGTCSSQRPHTRQANGGPASKFRKTPCDVGHVHPLGPAQHLLSEERHERRNPTPRAQHPRSGCAGGACFRGGDPVSGGFCGFWRLIPPRSRAPRLAPNAPLAYQPRFPERRSPGTRSFPAMAVPKRKTTPSRRGMRRAHD